MITTDLKEIPNARVTSERGPVRMWTDGERISRADAAMVPALDVATVDAVFEEPAISFLAEPTKRDDQRLESLATQLVALEEQCAKIRRLLNVAD